MHLKERLEILCRADRTVSEAWASYIFLNKFSVFIFVCIHWAWNNINFPKITNIERAKREDWSYTHVIHGVIDLLKDRDTWASDIIFQLLRKSKVQTNRKQQIIKTNRKCELFHIIFIYTFCMCQVNNGSIL